MQVEFNLTVTIKGNSLQEIDDGLLHAATERLMARVKTPPTLNNQQVSMAMNSLNVNNAKINVNQNIDSPPRNDIVKQFERNENAQQIEIPEKKKPGRRPKEKSNEELSAQAPVQSQTQIHQESPVLAKALVQETKQSEAKSDLCDSDAEANKNIESSVKKDDEVLTTLAPSQEEALEWLRKLCDKSDFTKGIELLARCGASKVRELTDKSRAQFVELCKQEVEVKSAEKVHLV